MARTPTTDATRPKLTAEDVERLKEDIAQKKAMLEAGGQFGDGAYAPVIPGELSIDKEKIRAEMKRLQAILDRDTPERESDAGKRDKIVARRKALEDLFKPYLETHQDIGAIRMDSPEYKAAFNKLMQRPKVEKYIHEWQELGKMLDPDDPTINDLDRLRSAK